MPFSDIGRAAENRLYLDIIPVLKAKGWHPRAIPYTGYGNTTQAAAHNPHPQGRANQQAEAPAAFAGTTNAARPTGNPGTQPAAGAQAETNCGVEPQGADAPRDMARVLARMVMRPANAPAEGPLFRHIPATPPENAAQVRDIALESLLDAQRGWRQFIDVPVPYLPITITLGAASVTTRADRNGYVDVVVRGHGLPAGWHEATIQAPGAGSVTTRVNIVSGPALGIICDIDDTVMVTNVPRALIAGWNLLMKNAANRETVPGMVELIQRVTATHGGPLLFLSTGAWNVVPTLRHFFGTRGLPEAPMLMTDWGPTNTGWFRSGIEHKRTELRRLLIDLPDVQWLLIGDDGQHDPLIYSEVVREHSDRIAAVAIRHLSHKEQVLAGASFANPMGIGPAARTLAESDVPVVVGNDGYELARLLPDWVVGS